jgi:hypothetical protein
MNQTNVPLPPQLTATGTHNERGFKTGHKELQLDDLCPVLHNPDLRCSGAAVAALPSLGENSRPPPQATVGTRWVIEGSQTANPTACLLSSPGECSLASSCRLPPPCPCCLSWGPAPSQKGSDWPVCRLGRPCYASFSCPLPWVWVWASSGEERLRARPLSSFAGRPCNAGQPA